MIFPENLKFGDKVAVVATAKKVDRDNTLNGIQILKSWGLRVVPGAFLFEQFHDFAGTDDHRLRDIQDMINDSEIKAIFVARGGYGSIRIIDQINFQSMLKKPKWICGFSDITAIHLKLYKLGIASLHAPMPAFFHAVNDKSLLYLKNILFGSKEKYSIKSIPFNRPSRCSGKITGGNLSLICNSIGTPSEVVTKDHILFIEDVGEKLYHVDRMVMQLKRAGKLKEIAGLIVGQFSDMQDQEKYGFDAYEIIKSHIVEFDYPVAFNFPIGHTQLNYPIIIGQERELIVGDSLVELN